jgi:hypothetical protein
LGYTHRMFGEKAIEKTYGLLLEIKREGGV